MLAQIFYDSILSKNLNSMKKFLLSFIIIAVFSGFVFWTGWTQAKVPPKYCGIVVSKTDGVSENPVTNGKFSWYWQFLLPTNAQIQTFNIQPLSFSKSFATELPSSDFVKQVFKTTATFDYTFSFDIMLTVSPEGLLGLYKENMISDEKSLYEYLDGAATYIAQMAGGYFIKKSQENPKFRPETVRRDDLMRYVQPYIEYPQIEVSTVALTSYTLADTELFNVLKARLQTDSINFEKNDLNTDSTDTGNDDE